MISSLHYKLSDMEEVYLRFQHLSEQIFNNLDNKSLVNCKEVSRSWNNFLEGQKFLHVKVILETVTKMHKVGKSWFQVFKSCKTKTIIDLRIAVEHLYQESGIFASYKERMDLLNIMKVLTAHHNHVCPLHVAAAYGQLNLFNNILQRVENKYPSDGLGQTTLYYATINDHLNIFESIAAINGNVVQHSTTKWETTTALDAAITNSSLKVCRFIVKNNWEELPRDNEKIWTSLHVAVIEGHTEIYKIIMEKFSDKNPIGIWGMTPLHFAAQLGNLAMCRLILENVQNKSPVTRCGKTPMELAEAQNHNEVLKLFP